MISRAALCEFDANQLKIDIAHRHYLPGIQPRLARSQEMFATGEGDCSNEEDL
jgi:hypothetical protein